MQINARARVGTSYATRQMDRHVGHDVARGGAHTMLRGADSFRMKVVINPCVAPASPICRSARAMRQR